MYDSAISNQSDLSARLWLFPQSIFRIARDKAEKRAEELGIKYERFQFRDLLAKNAAGMEKESEKKYSQVLNSGYAKREK